MVDGSETLAKLKKRRGRLIDEEYVKWIHGWRCIIPGCVTPWPVQAHHYKTRGAGGGDHDTIPLCPNHHVGTDGIHLLGRITFAKKFCIEIPDIISELNLRFKNGEKGPMHHRL